MVCYSKSVIYKIVCNTDKTLIYIGSSCNFITRKSHHKSSCNNPNGKKYNYPLYTMIRDNGGWDNFRMVIIEEYPCENKTQLCIREEELRVEYKANMNGYSAYTNEKEYKKEYYQNNKETINEKNKEYYQNNKETLNENKKEYYQNNKEKILEKLTCECGCIITKKSINRHLKSDKHKKLIGKE